MLVKVYSTQMGEREVETSATTWGELQRDLRSQSISYDGMKSVIGESKLTLEADAAVLPTAGFTLFLMPKKTKAGADINSMSYKEIRAAIKDAIDYKEEQGKAHFNVGKNYTTKGTEELRGLLGKWLGQTVIPQDKKSKKVKAKAPKKNIPDKKEKKSNSIIEKAKKITEEISKEKNVADVVESVKESKEKPQDCIGHSEQQEMEFNTQDSNNTEFEMKTPRNFNDEPLTIEDLTKVLNDVDHSMFTSGERELLDMNLEDAKKALKDYFDNITFYFQKRAEEEKIAKEKAEEEARLEAIRKEEEAKAREKIRLEEEAKAKERALKAEEKANNEAELRRQANDLASMFGDVK